jgi:DNA-cytosine methyltransferase
MTAVRADTAATGARPPGAGPTAGSLFSGIGGIDVAFAAAGFDIRFQVEIDPFCRKVLAKHAPNYWPNATQHVDIRDVGRAELGIVDVLFGGFPCQDISIAGKGAGIEGERSGLWQEFRRLIGDIRPRVVFVENVPAITSRGGTAVIAHFAAMGYDARWGIVGAADAGAPHQRDRWFCVAYADCDGLQKRTDYAASLCQATFPNTARDSHFTSVADTTSAGRRAGLRLQHRAAKSGRPEQGVGRGDWQQLEARAGTVSRYSDQRRDGAAQSQLARSADPVGWTDINGLPEAESHSARGNRPALRTERPTGLRASRRSAMQLCRRSSTRSRSR